MAAPCKAQEAKAKFGPGKPWQAQQGTRPGDDKKGTRASPMVEAPWLPQPWQLEEGEALLQLRRLRLLRLGRKASPGVGPSATPGSRMPLLGALV